jgi:hypothetical protein
MKKTLLIGLLSFVSIVKAENYFEKQWNTFDPRAKAVVTLFATGAGYTFLDSFGESKSYRRFADMVGIGTEGFKDIAGLTGSLVSLEFLGLTGAANVAKRIPVAMFVYVLVRSKFFQNVASNVPVIGQYLKLRQEKNIEDQRVNDIKKFLLTLSIYMALERAFVLRA